MANWGEVVQEKHKKNNHSMDRVSQVQMRKNEIDAQNVKLKYFMLHKWTIIKDKNAKNEVIMK